MKRSIVNVALILVVGCGLCYGYTAINKPAVHNVGLKAGRSAAVTPGAKGAFFEFQTMCAGPIPAGWVKTDDSWNPTTCGNPTHISYNVYTIMRIDNLPSGSMINACSIPAPAGWIVTGTSWNPTSCGHPTNISQNVMSLRKL